MSVLSFVILDATEVTVEAAALDGVAKVTCCAATTRDGSDVAAEALEGADVIGVWHTVWIDDAILHKFPPSVRLLVRFGVGYDNVDLKACAARGIRVCNCPN